MDSIPLIKTSCLIRKYLSASAKSTVVLPIKQIRKIMFSFTSVFVFKHILDRHDSIPQDINVDILAMCSGDAMLRQVTEAVFINEWNPTLNTKEEWGNSNKLREQRNVFEFIDFANQNAEGR